MIRELAPAGTDHLAMLEELLSETDGDPAEVRRRLGKIALEADTVREVANSSANPSASVRLNDSVSSAVSGSARS